MRDVAQFFKLLADEARLQILWLLFNHQELCVCDIVESLGITQSKASRHLAALRHAELVADRREDAWSYYSVRAPENELERRQLESLRTELARHPVAVQVLSALHTWLEHKRREALYAPGGACGAAKRADVGRAGERKSGAQRPRARTRALAR